MRILRVIVKLVKRLLVDQEETYLARKATKKPKICAASQSRLIRAYAIRNDVEGLREQLTKYHRSTMLIGIAMQNGASIQMMKMLHKYLQLHALKQGRDGIMRGVAYYEERKMMDDAYIQLKREFIDARETIVWKKCAVRLGVFITLWHQDMHTIDWLPECCALGFAGLVRTIINENEGIYRFKTGLYIARERLKEKKYEGKNKCKQLVNDAIKLGNDVCWDESLIA